MNKYYGKEIGGVSRSERASGDLTGGSGGGRLSGVTVAPIPCDMPAFG